SIPDEKLVSEICKISCEDIKKALETKGKIEKYAALDKAKEKVINEFKTILDEKAFEEQESLIKKAFEQIVKQTIREKIVKENYRPDGRSVDEIRNLSCEVDILPTVHGSGLFTRGETQSLGVITLGSSRDEKMIDGLEETYNKKFFLHYNFPPFSVGETGRLATGRRELGHGALAERSLIPVMPQHDSFPYTIRVVSEILESNGSSSMATICSSSMALMSAGVPITSAVAGIAMGLIKEGNDYTILTDIQGMEDHYGDMDFKVAGTEKGITSLQMDIKITGITTEIMKESLGAALKARKKILEAMNKTIDKPRPEVAKTAPQIDFIKIPQSKIGLLIGPGGANIKGLSEKYSVVITVGDEGVVQISSSDKDKLDGAKNEIANMCTEPEIGKIYKGRVVKITNFGAFLEILPGVEGLLHISQIKNERVENVEEILKPNDTYNVKLKEIDNQGRLSFTMIGIDQE
ncbi:polyribonucleotide nucleotidyltransferase, partial [Candidatus Margulisiibacteriota bacterium]